MVYKKQCFWLIDNHFWVSIRPNDANIVSLYTNSARKYEFRRKR